MTRALPAELARHLAHLLKRTRRRYRKRLARCQEKFSETAVHELRVETRRALALLDLVQALKVGGPPKKARKALKRRLDAFDDLRDAQVGRLILEALPTKPPESDEFETFLRKRQRKLVTQLRREIKALKPRRIERLLKLLEKDVAAASEDSEKTGGTRAVLSKPLEAAFRRIARLQKRIRRTDTETIHRTRIAFKTFRYLCELLQPFLPWMTARRFREMHAWQTRMGDIQDMEVLLAQMERAVKHGHVRLQSVKRLHAVLARRLVVLVKQFVSTADRLERFRPRFDSDAEPKLWKVEDRKHE